jgi:hypothetical protein
MKDGVAFYVGPFEPSYAEMRPQRVRVVNAAYRPYVAFRPTVEVAPPPEWRGEVWIAPPAVEVQAPGVYVERPHVGVEIDAPGVYVERPRVGVEVHAPGVFVAPPPRVVVHAPPPVVVAPPRVYVPGPPSVVVGAPGAVYVGGGRRHHDRDDDDDQGHDRGRHEGWRKHGRD